MAVTNREADAWTRVARAAADRRLAKARKEAIARLMAEPPKPVAVNHQSDRATAIPSRQLGLI